MAIWEDRRARGAAKGVACSSVNQTGWLSPRLGKSSAGVRYRLGFVKAQMKNLPKAQMEAMRDKMMVS